ncbi:MAG: ABC transporter ATP-binding protein/permease [bacterium]|nr:ABC transporter ATP-binding protein/permease [bacterium]
MSNVSSRSQFQNYLEELAERRSKSRHDSNGADPHHDRETSGSSHAAGEHVAGGRVSERHRTFWQLLAEFWRQLEGHHGKVIFSLATLTVSTLLALLPPAGTKLAIDYVLTTPPQPMPEWLRQWVPDVSRMGLLWLIAGAVTTITLLRTAIHLWGRWYATKAVNLVQADIRRRVFDHSLRLPLHRIQDLKSGGATSLIREDAGGTADLIFNMLYNPWQAIIQLLGSLFVLVLVDWRLMLGGLCLLPAVWITHRTWIHRVRPLYKDIRKRRQSIDASTTETFGGIRVVRTFARNKTETSRFARATHLLARQQLMVWWATRVIEIVWEVLIPLASTGLLLYGGWQILQAQLTLGDLMMFLVYLTMLLGPIASIASSAMSFQNNLAGLDRVLDLLAENTEKGGDPGAVAITRAEVDGNIRFDQVSFQYPGSDRQVLQDISFYAPAGSTVALVGRSGAGKTTLCNLVARFYDPSSGHIELDDRPLNGIQLDSYRRLLGVVEQDVFLFDGSVRENIAYGRRGASDAEVFAAAEAAAARQFIEELPQGFDTLIGERGVKLSGGQRQRLAIARALLADPQILILDEATSNLDSESERLIQASLTRLLQGRTAFVIAHRLSTITHADLILVLDQGRIAEMGTHQELLERGGLYQRMVLLQTEDVSARPALSDSAYSG